MTTRTVMISLMSSVGLLRSAFHDYTQLQIKRGNTAAVKYLVEKGALDYQAGEVMRHMVREIFDTDKLLVVLPESTLAIMRDGMDEMSAKELALVVFRATIDSIGYVLKNITFGSLQDTFVYDFCGEYDLMISFDDRNLEPS